MWYIKEKVEINLGGKFFVDQSVCSMYCEFM